MVPLTNGLSDVPPVGTWAGLGMVGALALSRPHDLDTVVGKAVSRLRFPGPFYIHRPLVSSNRTFPSFVFKHKVCYILAEQLHLVPHFSIVLIFIQYLFS